MTTHVVGRRAIKKALMKFPDLSAYGFPDRAEGDRSDIDPKEVETAMAFLKQLDRNKIPNLYSYGLKHTAERWGKKNGMQPYVTNGALIAAAIALDFNIKTRVGNSVAKIGVSVRSMRRLNPIWPIAA